MNIVCVVYLQCSGVSGFTLSAELHAHGHRYVANCVLPFDVTVYKKTLQSFKKKEGEKKVWLHNRGNYTTPTIYQKKKYKNEFQSS